MNTLGVLAAAVAMFALGYGIALTRHDTNRHEWQVAWLIGENRRAFTQLRRIHRALGLDEPPGPGDPEPDVPRLALRTRAASAARALLSRLRRRPDAQPTTDRPDPHPDDQWREQFTFSTEGRRKT